MGIPIIKRGHKFTYKEYCSWQENERWELINGDAYDMSPAPSSRHQKISFKLSTQFGVFLENKSCDAYSAPFDVLLPDFPIENQDSIDTVVQPDISVICDSKKIIERGCLGAPDLIVEILSPSTSKKDLNEKFQLYEKHSVKEYWIVDPGNKYIRVFHLITDDNKISTYDDGILIPPANWEDNNNIAESTVLNGFKVNVKELFD